MKSLMISVRRELLPLGIVTLPKRWVRESNVWSSLFSVLSKPLPPSVMTNSNFLLEETQCE